MGFTIMEKNSVHQRSNNYDLCPIEKKVCVQFGDELYEKNLRHSFKLGRINVGIFC